jgi:hypothetical protein
MGIESLAQSCGMDSRLENHRPQMKKRHAPIDSKYSYRVPLAVLKNSTITALHLGHYRNSVGIALNNTIDSSKR